MELGIDTFLELLKIIKTKGEAINDQKFAPMTLRVQGFDSFWTASTNYLKT
jgi:hypothetical protein